jgi:hypothetical protein
VINGYGRCWRPTVCVYDPGWRPYCDRGRWVYTDCGWYWSSDYAWGATFHYGRWFQNPGYGWCWCPDTVWGPSWVTWRYSNAYCGWAPLPPFTTWQAGVGFVYRGGGVSVGFGFGLGANCFTFVPTQFFCNSHPRNFCASPAQTTQIFNNTTVINNFNVRGSGHNRVVVNNGIPVQNVAAAAHEPIRPVPVHDADRSFAHGGNGQMSDRPGRVFGGNHPSAPGNAGSPAQPTTPTRTISSAPTTGQYPPHSIVINGNGNSRPTHFEAPVRTQPERNNPVTPVPQRPVPPANYRSPTYSAPVQVPPANYNSSPRPAPARWQQQPEIPRGYNQVPAPRQNVIAENQRVAPRVTYSAPPQPRSYNEPRYEAPRNSSPPPAAVAPQSSRQNYASAPAPQQQQGGGRGWNQNWPSH